MFSALVLAVAPHTVRTPVMGDVGYRVSLELPARWRLEFESASSPYPYRELDGKVLDGKRLVCRIAIDQWSRSRARRFHLLRRRVHIGGKPAYVAHDAYDDWLSIPKAGADLCLCINASNFRRRADQVVWEAELRAVRTAP